MYSSTALAYEAIKSIDSASFTGSYQNLGAATTHEARLFKFVNNSNVTFTVSIDGGTTDHDVVPAGTFVLYDVGTNKGGSSPGLQLPKGTQFMVKGAAGVGLCYGVVLYANTPAQTIPL